MCADRPGIEILAIAAAGLRFFIFGGIKHNDVIAPVR
jgi:hypothetical protein